VGVNDRTQELFISPQVFYEVVVNGVVMLTVNVRLYGGVGEKRLQSVCLTHRLHEP